MAQIKSVHVEGLSQYTAAVEENKGKEIFALFTGGVDENGKSWCPDCVKAHPVIETALTKAPTDAIFIHCSVGDSATWKNPQNEFRTQPKLLLKGVPTLIKVGTREKLVEADCANPDLVSMLFAGE